MTVYKSLAIFLENSEVTYFKDFYKNDAKAITIKDAIYKQMDESWSKFQKEKMKKNIEAEDR